MPSSKLQRELTRALLHAFSNIRLIECARPEWLQDEKGNRLEIDVYLPDYNIGIEVQGDQHFQYIPFFHRSVDGFKSQISRDALKRDLCFARGLDLIEITDSADITDVISAVERKAPELIIPLVKSPDWWIRTRDSFVEEEVKGFAVITESRVRKIKDKIKKIECDKAFCANAQWVSEYNEGIVALKLKIEGHKKTLEDVRARKIIRFAERHGATILTRKNRKKLATQSGM